MSRKPIRAGIRATGAGSEETRGIARLRDAFARWATGVTVVAVRDEDDVIATTATAFVPVSLEPPLVLVCLGPHAGVLPFLEPGAGFAISVLAEEQRRVASLAADSGPLARSVFAPDGDPVVPGAMAAFRCTVREILPGGDHRIVVGEVDGVDLGPPARPLLYFEREYRRLR